LGLPALNSGIPKLASPTSASYGIMHNKFMVIDANSSNTDESYVWTGSSNWSEDQIFNAVNNFIIIQDQPLAKAYLTEFNEMWGDTGMISNASNSKFGPDKSNNTPHNFTVGGVNIELYFSPSDQTNNQILASINSADKELFFGVYTFTDSLDATAINAKYNQGLNVYGIIDSFSVPFRAYNILSPVLQTNLEVYDIGTSIYHSKMLLVDPNVVSSDPLVLTGSHNWSKSADTKNDENTLIIHDATVANIYYQSFSQNFKDLGGVLPTAIQDLSESTFTLYPNPNNGNFTVTFSEKNSHSGKCELYDLSRRMVWHQEITSSTDKLQFQIDETVSSGTYFIHFFPQGSTQLISIVK
jgi:phosphatidylserine/phosphatidylglycerophosphate/cardiolipin synthase-like enzyme